jgi:hypothetical protein
MSEMTIHRSQGMTKTTKTKKQRILFRSCPYLPRLVEAEEVAEEAAEEARTMDTTAF